MKKRIRIMVFGTFDVLHKGHLHFFMQAQKLSSNTFLIVSLARDENVKAIKGRQPLFKLRDRMAAVKKTGLAQRVVAGALKNYLGHIVHEKPDIIALGYDQSEYIDGLLEKLKKRGLHVRIFRLKPYKPHVYKSSLVKRRLPKSMRIS